MPKTIHVVFKTHLDVGFTGMGAEVLRRYRDEFIPKAIALAEAARSDTRDISFIWTTGSWLIQHALDCGTTEQAAELDAAIVRGDVAWHALPLSTHTEIMDPELVDYGISISHALDARYGRHTRAAKMTDVPGHTIGLVPLLARGGIRYLHIGVNPASALPEVPGAFVWQAPDGTSVIVNYDATYGASEAGRVLEIEGTDSALYIAQTNDNVGPQDVDDVADVFEALRRNYPGARVQASTLDAFAADLEVAADRLPVVHEEIGDTWIHGPASDPLQLARFRALLRLQQEWLTDGHLVRGSQEYRSFNDPLLLIAEHTWGKDFKSFLPDFVNYPPQKFAEARSRDHIEPGLFPPDMPFLQRWTNPPAAGGYSYSAYEASWAEQRNYIEQAVSALPPALAPHARSALAHLSEPLPPLQLQASDASAMHKLGPFTARFGDDGAIVSLVDQSGRDWASDAHPIGALWHESFAEGDYQQWYDNYCRGLDLSANGEWAISDFGKPGLAHTTPGAVRQRRSPHALSLSLGSEESVDIAELTLDFPAEATVTYGAPRTVILRYLFDRRAPRLDIHLNVRDRVASRLPQATWLTINPIVAEPTQWTIHKLGTPIDPHYVVKNGNRNLHAVDSLTYQDSASNVELHPLDSPIVAMGQAHILEFDNTINDLTNGFHLNLHNNLWGTNFRMWYDDDITHRVRLSLGQA